MRSSSAFLSMSAWKLQKKCDRGWSPAWQHAISMTERALLLMACRVLASRAILVPMVNLLADTAGKVVNSL